MFKLKKIKLKKRASALLLTMFILAGMLIVAMSGSYVVLLGIRASGIQAQSVKAYFAAESGAEKILWELRKNSYQPKVSDIITQKVIFSGTLPQTGANYEVYFTAWPPLVFDSIGSYKKTKRSTQIRI